MTQQAMDMKQLADNLSCLLARTFRDEGYELYLVGGAVRDQLLRVSLSELDFATSAHPKETLRLVSAVPDASTYRVGEKYGTIGARVGPLTVEITTYRTDEQYQPGSRKPSVRFGTTLLEDLSRRDFTINAIARDPLAGTIIDPLGGRQDLENRLVKAVGSAPHRFQEDPLRLLRAVRFASRLGFEIESGTWRAMQAEARQLAHIARERIRDEYSAMLAGPSPVQAMELLRQSGLMEHSVPQLCELTRMSDHGPRHPLSLWEHVMLVLQRTSSSLEGRWTALLHDIAKPATRTHEPNGRPRFFHHEEVGAVVAREGLGSLHYPSQFIDDVALLISTHMQLHAYSPDWSDGAVRRLMLRLGPLLPEAITFARADGAGHSQTGESYNSPKFDHLEKRLVELSDQPVEQLDSPLSGNDLMERYGRPPGPWIRAIKERLLNDVLDGTLAPGDRDSALRIADEIVELETAS
jgi:poly(A) polymerase